MSLISEVRKYWSVALEPGKGELCNRCSLGVNLAGTVVCRAHDKLNPYRKDPLSPVIKPKLKKFTNNEECDTYNQG